MGSQDLQTGRYDQLIRRVGGLYGGGSKVVETLPELFPVLELENTTPELIALSGWRTCWQSTERPPLAANQSASQLFNPAGSNVIAAVTQLMIRTNIATFIQAELQASQLGGTPVPGLFRDSRFGVPRRSTLTVESVDGVAVGGGLRLSNETNETVTVRDDNGIAVLTPGFGLSVGTTSNQVQMTVNYLWRERPALESEINFP